MSGFIGFCLMIAGVYAVFVMWKQKSDSRIRRIVREEIDLDKLRTEREKKEGEKS